MVKISLKEFRIKEKEYEEVRELLKERWLSAYSEEQDASMYWLSLDYSDEKWSSAQKDWYAKRLVAKELMATKNEYDQNHPTRSPSVYDIEEGEG